MTREMSQNQVKYNNTLFEQLLPIYDTVASIISSVRQEIAVQLEEDIFTVLDVACGTGTQANLLFQKGFKVTGVDISPEMLARAKEKYVSNKNLKFIHADACGLPFPDHGFDGSVISFGLHDMPDVVRVLVLEEMKRVTKSGGVIVIADYDTSSRNLLSKMGELVSNLFESKYYPDFMDKGLEHYLGMVGLHPISERELVGGIACVIKCSNN